jgi:predicted nucleic acid-binding protein
VEIDPTNTPINVSDQSNEEALQRLHALLRMIQQFGGVEFIELYIDRFVLVLDTNIVVPDIRAGLLSRRVTELQSLLASRVFSFLAPAEMEAEILHRLPLISKKEQIPESQIMSTWEQRYRPHIKFVDHLPNEPSELVAFLRDPSDTPFVTAYEKLKADAVLTNDPDLTLMQIAAFRSPQFVMDLRQYALSKSFELQVVTAATVWSVAGIGAIISLIRLIVVLVRRFPVISIFGLGIILFFALSPKGREKFQSVKAGAKDIFETLMSSREAQTFVDASVQARELGNRLRDALPMKQELAGLKDYVRRVLSEALEPLTLDQIQEKVQLLGYNSTSSYARAYLRRLLNKLPEVIGNDQGRWRIGRM